MSTITRALLALSCASSLLIGCADDDEQTQPDAPPFDLCEDRIDPFLVIQSGGLAIIKLEPSLTTQTALLITPTQETRGTYTFCRNIKTSGVETGPNSSPECNPDDRLTILEAEVTQEGAEILDSDQYQVTVKVEPGYMGELKLVWTDRKCDDTARTVILETTQ